MTENNTNPNPAASTLRQRAEAKFSADKPPVQASRSPEATEQVLHELEVHQIELEMQNDELRRTQSELEAARARYFDLYDLAPVGYVTLSETGLILEANLTAAQMLGVDRRALVKQPELILADEPTGSLDPRHTRGVVDKLREVCSTHGCSLVVVSHQGDVVSAFENRVSFLELNRAFAENGGQK